MTRYSNTKFNNLLPLLNKKMQTEDKKQALLPNTETSCQQIAYPAQLQGGYYLQPPLYQYPLPNANQPITMRRFFCP